MAIRVKCCHAVDLNLPATVQCKLGLYGGQPHAGTCQQCEGRNQSTGLGDILAKIAQPIAHGLDHALGTQISTCGGCSDRQTALNQRFPLQPKAKASTPTASESPSPASIVKEKP